MKIIQKKKETSNINDFDSKVTLDFEEPNNLIKNEFDLKEILFEITQFLSEKSNNQEEVGSLVEKIDGTLKLIDDSLKDDCNNKNKTSLLILLQSGFGKYMATIIKIFENQKLNLNEVFSKFEKQFSDLYNKIKYYVVHRYLTVDEQLLRQYKIDFKTDNKSRKNSEIFKQNILFEEDFFKEMLENNKEDSKKTKNNENFFENLNINDPNFELQHFRKKFCVKIAKILQLQYGYEKQKSHEVTIKIEKKLRKEFPLMNSEYKANGIFLLNLLKVFKIIKRKMNLLYFFKRIIPWIS